ncbi:hypothetical protein [Blastococcus saxobsidens]|uniref:Uncharacterized protein n=1 Tax=Blastococcus saxobsidens (strain DD2) TaxID=1146883 RepID=H6RQA2_BLASD|nr:hypothetical protein [Blastococcus saxobsidens]CCG04069.1 conserved membrane protein of unknown function [Blastococcus saxobsidens DD2]
MPTTTSGAPGPLLLAALAAVAHLVVGYFYVVSGLAVPLYALLPLWLLWLVLALVLIRLTVLRSWWTPLVPVGAAALLVGTVVAGDSLLGWQA